MKISKAFNLYIEEEILNGGGSHNTAESYNYAQRAFVRSWGNIEVEAVDGLLISRFSTNFRQHHSIRTLRNYLACLRSVLAMCERRGFQVMAYDAIRLPKAPKTSPAYLHKDEVKKLIAVAGRGGRGYPAANRLRNVLIVQMLFSTGLRVGELCRLNIDDIHDRQFIVIGKSKEPRLCFITPEVEELIKEYLALRQDSNPALFVSSQTGGKRLSPKTVQALFRRIGREAGLHGVHPHTLRHSFCTQLLRNGVDIRHTAMLMGHQSWDTTRIYTHIENPELKQVYDGAFA